MFLSYFFLMEFYTYYDEAFEMKLYRIFDLVEKKIKFAVDSNLIKQ